MQIEMMPLDEIKLAKRNPKQHDLNQLSASGKRFGFVSPLLMNERTKRLVAGHGRIEWLKGLRDSGEKPPKRIEVNDAGDWLVPVVRGVGFKNAREAEAYLLADNRISERGGWDREMLGAILSDLDEDYGGTGYTTPEVDALLASLDEEEIFEPDNEEKLDGFLSAAVRQVILYFASDEFDTVVDRLAVVQEKEGLANHTEAVAFLLADYAARKGA